MTLTKADIAHKISGDCGFMKNEATEVLEKLLDIMKKKLIAGEDIMIYGFGKWHVRSKSPRRGTNPQTGRDSRHHRRIHCCKRQTSAEAGQPL